MDVMQVETILPVARQRLITTQTGASLADAAKLLCETDRALLVVCDPAGVMQGVITKTDIVRQVADSPCEPESLRVADVMARVVIACKVDDSLHDVLTMMKDQGFVHIPVIDHESRPIGVVNARDALRALFTELTQEHLLLREYIMGIGYR
jgi:CBS domain-containing protein